MSPHGKFTAVPRSTPAPPNHLFDPQITALQECPPSILWHALRYLFPPACQLCGEALPLYSAKLNLCPTCITGCIQQPVAACPICAEPYTTSMVVVHPCAQCVHHPPPFRWLKSMGIHAERLQQAVQQLKYSGRFHLASPLTQLLRQCLNSEITDFAPQALIPVPLHPKRLRERGFNQSQLIAQQLGSALNISVNSSYLVRIRATRSQTDLSRQQRMQNLKEAFTLHGTMAPQRILLVDDVVTTTATSRECSRTLTRAGHEVCVVALGRTRLET